MMGLRVGGTSRPLACPAAPVSRRGEATLSPLPHAHLAHFQPLDADPSDRQRRELLSAMRRSPGGDQIEEKGDTVQDMSV